MTAWVQLLVVVAGATLLAGLVAFATAKGGAVHRAAGRAFHAATLGLALVVVPVALGLGDVFHALVGLMSAYLVHSGRREVLRHREGAPVGPAERLPLGGLALCGVGLVLWATAFASDEAPSGYTVVTAGFGGLLLYLSFTEWRRLARPPSEHGWLLQHVGAMGAAVVAVATAFGSIVQPVIALPSWMPWLAPIAIGGVVIVRWLAQVRREGVRATFL
jgi:hypothetical protein